MSKSRAPPSRALCSSRGLHRASHYAGTESSAEPRTMPESRAPPSLALRRSRGLHRVSHHARVEGSTEPRTMPESRAPPSLAPCPSRGFQRASHCARVEVRTVPRTVPGTRALACSAGFPAMGSRSEASMRRGHAPWGHGRAAERTPIQLRSRSIAAPGRASRLGFDSCNRLLCTPVRQQ
jgi:hypothetical protein